MYVKWNISKYLNLLFSRLLNSPFTNTLKSFVVLFRVEIWFRWGSEVPRGASSLLRGLSLLCALSESYAYLRTYVWNDARKEEAGATRGLIVLTRSYYIIPTLLIFINLVSTWGVRFQVFRENDTANVFMMGVSIDVITTQIMMWSLFDTSSIKK